MACSTEVDYSCLSTKSAAEAQIKQDEQDIANYNTAIADIEAIDSKISECTEKLDCAYNNSIAAVTDPSISASFENISNYSNQLDAASTDLAAAKRVMLQNIAVLKADINNQKQIIHGCGSCTYQYCTGDSES